MTISELMEIVPRTLWYEEIHIRCNGEAGDFPIRSVMVDYGDKKIIIIYELE